MDSTTLPFHLDMAVIGTTLATMATSWLIFALIGPTVLRAVFPAYERLDVNKRVLMNETFLSLCHGAVLGTSSACVFAFDDVRPDQPMLYSALQHHNCGIFLGYSLSDFLLMLKYPSIATPGFLIHHVVSIYIGLTGVMYAEAAWYGTLSQMMELSNPFSNMRVLLDELGLRKSHAYVMNGVAMLVVFFMCRLLPVPMYWYHMAQLCSTGQLWEVHLPIIVALTGIATIHVLNVVWFRKICVGAAKVLMANNE